VSKRSLLILSILTVSACTAEPRDHADPGPELGEGYETRLLAVSCDPKIVAYPVLGPHNGGWDNNALDFTCPSHPGSSPDNSDWIPNDHYGNDIFAEKGELAVAPVSGVVVKSGWNNVGGWRVTMEDACGWWYYSAHLDEIDPIAQLGATLSAGTVIGTVGNTGNAQGTAPHIHFSVYPAGDYTNGVDPFPYLQAADNDSCDDSSVPPPPPPPTSSCPSGQNTKICEGSYTLLTCVNGSKTDTQNCDALGAFCSELVGAQAACVSTQCTPSPNVAPQTGSAMCIGGVRHLCDSQGWPQSTPCPTGLSCVGSGQCEGGGGPTDPVDPPTDPECPPSGKATLCNGQTTYVSCGSGVKTGSGDCALFGGICIELTAGSAGCVDPVCTAPVTLTYVEHALCVNGERVLCDATGWSSPSPCPAGQSCAGDGQCVAAPAVCEPESERCNLQDDDCDGVIDESLPVVLGTACPTNIANCDALGVWTCGPGEVPVCVTDPTLCPAWATPDPGASTSPGAGGVFTPPETNEEPLEPVTTTCASGPTPQAPWVLVMLWLVARLRRRAQALT
jgi:hypothetical protein